MIAFFAPGIPRPKGSKRLVRTKGGQTLLLEASEREKPWRQLVTTIALDTMQGTPPVNGAVELELIFEFPRPKAHYTTKGLRPTAPTHHISKPDVSKLIRSVEDALNAIVFHDDSAVARVVAVKLYTETTPGVHVRVRPLRAPGLADLLQPHPQPHATET